MTIINPLPFTLQNGTVADASEVMANLNQIRNDVNNNGAGGGGSGNVVGPASAVDGHLAVFDGTTGKIIRDGGTIGYRGAVAAFATDPVVGVGDNIVAFDLTSIDTDSIHSNTVNNSRLTVPAGVTKVRFFFSTAFYNADGATAFSASLRKNSGGDLLLFQVGGAATTANYATSNVTAALVCTAGDYFEIVFNNVDRPGTQLRAADTFFEMQVLG